MRWRPFRTSGGKASFRMGQRSDTSNVTAVGGGEGKGQIT